MFVVVLDYSGVAVKQLGAFLRDWFHRDSGLILPTVITIKNFILQNCMALDYWRSRFNVGYAW